MEEKKTRRRYTKEEKLLVLKEYSISKKSKAAFEKLNIDFENISNDKKYFSKLINKWKKELYLNKNTADFFAKFHKYSTENISQQDRFDYITKDYLELKKKNKD